MATAAISAEYLEDAEDVRAELAENGHELSFGVMADGARARDAVGAYLETGKSNVFPLDWSANFSADVRQDDKFYMTDNSIDLESCTHAVDGATRYQIKHVKPFKPDNQLVIYYEMQLRVSRGR